MYICVFLYMQKHKYHRANQAKKYIYSIIIMSSIIDYNKINNRNNNSRGSVQFICMHI